MVGIYLLVTVLVLVAISSLVSSLMEEFLVSQRTQDQLQETSRLALEVAPYMSGADVDELFTYIEDRAYSMGGRVLVLDSDAVVQMDSASRENGFLLPYREVREVLREGKDSAYGFHHILRGGDEGVFTQGDQSIWAVYYTVPLTISGHRDGAVLFSASIQDVVDSLNEVTRQITVIFVAVVIIIIIAIFLLSGWITKPIVELTSAIRRMGTQGYVRVDEKGSGEIAELGRAFNRMSERIEDHDRVRDEFVANASHELKTPLQSIMGSAELIENGLVKPEDMPHFINNIRTESARLVALIEDIIRLSRLDEGVEIPKTEVDLLNVATETAELLRGNAEAKKVSVKVHGKSAVVFGVDRLIYEIAYNLCENAVKYNIPGGAVDIGVDARKGKALLTVRDTGIGIPKEQQSRVFERFYRVDKSRSKDSGGTGLGLSIVKHAAAYHNAELTLESVPGKGTCVTVAFPLYDGSENAE